MSRSTGRYIGSKKRGEGRASEFDSENCQTHSLVTGPGRVHPVTVTAQWIVSFLSLGLPRPKKTDKCFWNVPGGSCPFVKSITW